MNSKIEHYFEQSGSNCIDIATVLDPKTGEIFLMLAPEYSICDKDGLYDEIGALYELLNYATFSKDDKKLDMIDDLNRGASIKIVKRRIEERKFKLCHIQ